MSDTYKFKRVEIRRVIEEACQDVIRDKKIAEQLYMKIMMPLEDFLSDCKYEPMTEPTRSKMEQVDKDTNVRSKEPQTDEEYINNLPWTEAGNGEQTDIEIARAIVHKMIDDAVIAEDAYPDLRQKMHDAVDNYEPQTEDKHAVCTGCDYYDLPNAFHPCASCVDFSKYKPMIEDEPQTERSSE